MAFPPQCERRWLAAEAKAPKFDVGNEIGRCPRVVMSGGGQSGATCQTSRPSKRRVMSVARWEAPAQAAMNPARRFPSVGRLSDTDNEVEKRTSATSKNIVFAAGKRGHVTLEVMANRLAVHNRA